MAAHAAAAAAVRGHYGCNIALPTLGDPLRGMYAEAATGLARVDHFVVLVCAAVVLYAFLVVELLKEVLRRGQDDDDDDGEEEDGDFVAGGRKVGEAAEEYDEKDDVMLIKQALGLAGGKRKRLDSMV